MIFKVGDIVTISESQAGVWFSTSNHLETKLFMVHKVKYFPFSNKQLLLIMIKGELQWVSGAWFIPKTEIFEHSQECLDYQAEYWEDFKASWEAFDEDSPDE
jgi:hypothetical protein